MRRTKLTTLFAVPMLAAGLLPSPARAADTNQPLYLDPAQPVEQRVENLLSLMTLDEKIDFLGGTNWYYLPPIPRLKIPLIKTSDGPMAARNDGPNNVPTTAYPAGIALAATWDRDMANKIGVALGRDCRSRGSHILLAPAVNIYRAPMCGRNFEYMGEDPFLAGALCAPMIQGIQSQQVMATIKHFACNNTEWNRRNLNVEVDERTLHEIYLPAFKAAVQQGKVACVMTAYNLLDGVHCSESDMLIHQILKRDWGFTGLVMSDWDSTYNGVNAANAGLDLEMPSAKFMNRATLLPAIKDGRVTEAVIDDKVRRILRELISYGFLDRPQVRSDIPRNDPENDHVALAGAREAIVLLKNEKHTLPLDRHAIKTVALLGPNALEAVYCAGGSAYPAVFHAVSVYEGVEGLAGADLEILTTTNAAEAVALAKRADAAVVCAGFNWRSEGEDYDRPYDLPAGQVEFIQSIAAANPRTIVVLNSGGGVNWSNWLDRVPAVLQAWYPGQQGGRAIAEILFGDVNPSGKLPATFEKRLEDNPSMPYYREFYDSKTSERSTADYATISADYYSKPVYQKTYYTEGIFVGYRGYDEKKIEPQFPFGHGLSYTEFKYGGLRVTPGRAAAHGPVTITLDVKNTGKVGGDEIVQLYTHQEKSSVKRPVKELKGFARVSLKPGETKTVSLTLDADQLGFYDVKTHGFVTEPGAYQIMAGSSSRDIRETGRLEVDGK
jgi:beta-glucosidase